MSDFGQDQHPDLAAELTQRLGQGLAVLGTLSEAAARLAAEEIRRRERREQQQHTADQRRDADAQRLRRHSDQLAQHAARRRAQHDRRVVAQALDPDWVARADLLDLATVWRTGRAREHEFPEARSAAEAVEERLREMYPRPMDLYDQAVRDGVPRAQAMRTAAEQMAHTPVMRAYGGRRSPTLTAGAVLGDDAFAAAVSDEQIRLATGVDPQTYAEELGQLGAGGDAAAQALREVLAARAGQELGHGRANAATSDDPSTVGLDEHTAVGMPRAGRDLGDAGRDEAAAAGTRTAAQLAGEWYPAGLHHPTALPGDIAAKTPATAAPAETPVRTTGRSR